MWALWLVLLVVPGLLATPASLGYTNSFLLGVSSSNYVLTLYWKPITNSTHIELALGNDGNTGYGAWAVSSTGRMNGAEAVVVNNAGTALTYVLGTSGNGNTASSISLTGVSTETEGSTYYVYFTRPIGAGANGNAISLTGSTTCLAALSGSSGTLVQHDARWTVSINFNCPNGTATCSLPTTPTPTPTPTPAPTTPTTTPDTTPTPPTNPPTTPPTSPPTKPPSSSSSELGYGVWLSVLLMFVLS